MRRPLLPVWLLLLLCCCVNLAQAAVVHSMRSYRSPEYTRLVFDLDTPLEHKVFTLENPDRLVIDLIGATFQGNTDELSLTDTPISGIRHAMRNEHDVRVVLDLNAKVQPRSFLLARNEQYGDRLVIDLYDDGGSNGERRDVVSAAPDSRRDIVVAISAGHGGEDPGAIGVNRLREKDVVLEIAREVQKRIDATPGFRAVMIREGDYYIGLRERMALAHQHNDVVDFYVAIHADAHTNREASGATLYALSQSGATSEQARLLAEKENAADLIGGVGPVSLTDKDEVLRSVLLDLSITGSIATSLEIGKHLLDSLDNVTTLRRNNVEQAAFVELKSADIPSLLVESGYITNAKDSKNLASPAWRQRFADALVSGIVNWFHERPPVGTEVAWQKEHGTDGDTYVVQRGDSLSLIAQRFKLDVSVLMFANDLQSTTIRVGQVLKIPAF